VLLPDSRFLIFCAEAVILLLESHNFSHQSFFNKSISTQTLWRAFFAGVQGAFDGTVLIQQRSR
jgi:hypothetical protein